MEKMRSRDYKALARQMLLGKYATVIGASFLSALVIGALAAAAIVCILTPVPVLAGLRSGAGSGFEAGGIVAAFAILAAFFIILLVFCACVLVMGEYKLMLNIARGERYSVTDLFFAFRRGSRPFKFIFTSLFISIVSYAASFIIDVAVNFAMYRVQSFSGVLLATAVAILVYIAYIIFFLGFSFALLIRTDFPETKFFEAIRESFRLMKKRRGRYILLSLSFVPWIFLLYASFLIAGLWVFPYILLTTVLFYLDARGELFSSDKPEKEPAKDMETARKITGGESVERVCAPEAENLRDVKDVSSEKAENEGSGKVETDDSDKAGSEDKNEVSACGKAEAIACDNDASEAENISETDRNGQEKDNVDGNDASPCGNSEEEKSKNKREDDFYEMPVL